jgi:hypothetical protein
MHTNIWTLKREEPQEGTWEGNWMKKALPAVGGKSLWGRFIYWGYIGIIASNIQEVLDCMCSSGLGRQSILDLNVE